jgi:hypothetical protein
MVMAIPHRGRRCPCGDSVIAVWFDGHPWCVLCALLLVGPAPAEKYLDDLGMRVEPGVLIGQRPARPPVVRGAVA